MTLRVNRRQGSVAQYLARLQALGLNGWPVGDDGVTLARPCPVQALPGFAEGAVSVQDAAAQQAAPLLLQALAQAPDLKTRSERWRVLDACAAPGGKTAHLLECGDVEVLALDADAQRCQRIHDTLARLQLQAAVRCADAGHPSAWWDGRLFDGILLDAPCTASGIVRRHPDVRWLRRESDVAQLAAEQERLLKALWPLLQPGGCLLYCTCSVFRDEGERRIQAFVAHNTDAVCLPSPGHLLPTRAVKSDAVPDNPAREHDGFFYALLRKTPPDPSRAG